MADKEKARLEEEEKYCREMKKQLHESLDNADKAFYKALEDMPTSSDFMKMQVTYQKGKYIIQ